MLGKVDFIGLVKRVAESMDNAIMKVIVKSIENAYVGQPNGLYHFAGTYDDAKLVDLIANVEARTGQRVAIFGTQPALANLRQAGAGNWAEADKMDMRNQGYIGKFNGRDVVELPNFMDANENLVLSQKHLFIIPQGTKIVKLVNEGKANVLEVKGQHDRLDNQVEYMFTCNYQLGVLKAHYYGVYEIQ